MEIEFLDDDLVFEIDHKRFKIPVKLTGTCPACGEEFERNFQENALVNPVANETEEITIWHETEDGQDCEFEVGLKLNVDLEIVE